MDATIITMYEIRGTSDIDYGGGRSYLVGYASTQEKAEELAKGRGEWGAPGTVRDVRAVRFASGETYVLGERVDDAYRRQNATRAAIAKLTPDERRLLGIKDDTE